MWSELHVFYELYYIYFLNSACEIFIIICNSCIMRHYGSGMAFAYNVAMTGIVKHIRKNMEFSFSDEYLHN
jgi:hypothetical protein